MLHAHCDLEPISEPIRLLDTASRIEAEWLDSRWIDWRDIGEEGESGTIGGCAGRLRLAGPGLEDLLWVILLATLFGIGKGAAYGAGQCRLLQAG
jgi:hypothetical protein